MCLMLTNIVFILVSIKGFQNTGHRAGFLPNYLNDIGINVIISGGMCGVLVFLTP